MSEIVYFLCALTALLCAVLLLRAYFASRYRLLLWSGLCFSALALNNTILILDKIAYPMRDFEIWRAGTGLAAMVVLLYGLIMEVD
jgi:hypothetical protein